MGKRGFVYFIRDPDPPPNGLIKIGKAKNVERRFKTFQTANPNIQLLGFIPGYTETEKELHKRFAHARVDREWFRPIPEIIKIATGGKGMNFNRFDEDEEEMESAYPPMMPMPYQQMYPHTGRTAPKRSTKVDNGKAAEKERRRIEAKRKERNKKIDRAFWAFWAVMLLILFLNTNLGG